ncbi:unnamed protein product [Rotaria magnacalcarata]|uniref:Uncharacterized protein n=1 Tax=Rotaria magnacalcarata TaxID=392030 RepID=A0A816U5K7_9BILA|nr:unnamed protein product [Rotaria magnacalcarata]
MIKNSSCKYTSICLLIAFAVIIFSWTKETQHITLLSPATVPAKHSLAKYSHSALTTVVIAYFPLKKSKHTKAKYLMWLENLLGYCQSPMIIFTSIEYQSVLYRLRRKGSLASYFIVNYSTPLQMPPIQHLLSIFEQQHKIDPERGYHSVELYATWCAKSFMINRSAELNPFNTNYFLYIDAGAFRSSTYQFRLWPHNEIIQKICADDRLLLGMIAPLPRGFCPLRYKTDEGPIRMDLVEGGIIGGSARVIHWWTSLFYETINHYISRNFFIAKDQYLMNAIALAHANRINMMLSFRVSCGNSWFAFGPLLANDYEKTNLSYSLNCRQESASSSIISFETVCNDVKNLI